MAHLRVADDNGRPVDIALFCSRLAQRLASQGLNHPQVAAAIISVRGAAAMSPRQFAQLHGVDPTDLAAAESGRLAWRRLPAGLAAVLDATPELDMGAVRQDPRASDNS